MTDSGRRGVLEFLGGPDVIAGGIGSESTAEESEGSSDEHAADPSQLPGVGSIHKLGHTLGSDPPGGYAEEDIRSDGQYAIISGFDGIGGSFLFDIRDPTNPTEVHALPSESTIGNADCAFDQRDGLYYRGQEPRAAGADIDGVEVVDYGYDRGSIGSPTIISKIGSGPTHNLFPHPTEDLLYTTNDDTTFQVWDVSDPFAPEQVGEGPEGDAHDMVVDPDRELMHVAGHVDIEGAEAASYIIMDTSDPVEPEVVGYIDYGDYPNLQETGIRTDEIVFVESGGHYANYDPERDIAVISDETGSGFPAPKTTVDIGWGEGSPQNPIPLDQQWVPNAELQDEPGENFDWTTHNHDIISKEDETLVVSGDYEAGTMLYNISDPEDIQPADQYLTDDMADEARGTFFQENAPEAWGANYNEERDLVVTSDMITGLYVFTVVPS